MIYAENILVCVAVPLLISLLFTKGSARRFVGSVLTGMVSCLLCAYIVGFIDIASKMGSAQTAVYISPIVEEFVKLLPLLFILAVFEPDDEMLLLSAVGVGTGFATFENCCYLITSESGEFSFFLIRGMAVGVMHIVCMITLAFGLEISKRFRLLSFQTVLGALSLSITFHAIYNLLVSEDGITSYFGYALPVAAAAFLYLVFRKFTEQEQSVS